MVTTVVRVVVAALLGVVGVLVGVRLTGLDRGLIATVMTAFPWTLVLGVVSVAMAAAIRWRPAVLIGVVIIGVGVALLLPRVLPDRQPDASGPDLTVLVANLFEGNGDADTIVAAVRDHDVDVLVTPELTPDAIERLSAAGLDDLLTPATLSPSRITSGIGVWTSVPTTVVRERGGSGRGFSRSNVDVVLDVAGTQVALTAVHPLPPINADWTRDWEATLADVPSAEADLLHVVAGDLNATLDHRALRRLLDRGYVDAGEVTGQGWRATYNGLTSGEPVPPVTIDHVLADPRIAVRGLQVLSLPGSDHRMLLARLQLPTN